MNRLTLFLFFQCIFTILNLGYWGYIFAYNLVIDNRLVYRIALFDYFPRYLKLACVDIKTMHAFFYILNFICACVRICMQYTCLYMHFIFQITYHVCMCVPVCMRVYCILQVLCLGVHMCVSVCMRM